MVAEPGSSRPVIGPSSSAPLMAAASFQPAAATSGLWGANYQVGTRRSCTNAPTRSERAA